jgi:hypothetical protein
MLRPPINKELMYGQFIGSPAVSKTENSQIFPPFDIALATAESFSKTLNPISIGRAEVNNRPGSFRSHIAQISDIYLYNFLKKPSKNFF